MKIDYDKKHPLTSVDLIPEDNEEEYLTEEQSAEFKKIGLRCVRISFVCTFFSVISLICEVISVNDLLNASKGEKILGIIGYVGLGCLIISIVILFIEGRKLNKLTKKYKNDCDK